MATASVHQTLAGQGCALGTRLLVHDSVYDELAEKVVGFTSAITLGDPFDPATGMGPVVSRSAQQRILAMVERARAEGTGKLLVGGGVPGQFQPRADGSLDETKGHHWRPHDNSQ